MVIVGTSHSSTSYLENDASEIGKKVIDLRKHVFDRGDDAFKELLFLSDHFEKKGDFFNAGYFYKRASESSLFPTNEKSGISTATEKSVETSVFLWK